jgi:drug/metabolite transporter (DMT)-like permease
MGSSAAFTDHKPRAVLFIFLAIALASTQDAIIKLMSSSYPVYETLLIRGLTALPLLGIWLALRNGLSHLATPFWPRLLLRSLVLCSAHMAYILAVAAMPIANTVAIYFTMPFFVAGLAGPLLGERVPVYRWIAIASGFIGVIVMVRPGVGAFEPASLLALYSAFGYAIGQMMGRPLARDVPPLAIANWQNAVYLIVAVVMAIVIQAVGFTAETHKSLAFLTRPFMWPTPVDFLLLCAVGVLAALTMMSFITAYRLAESNFVAPFEYSGMVWAILYGLLFFHDFPDLQTWLGMMIVVGAGLFMVVMDRRRAQIGYPAQALTVRSASDD